MHFTTTATALSLLALFTTTALAETREVDPKGNVKVDADAKAVNYGTTPPWDAIDKLKELCSTVGCSGGEAVKVKTSVIKDSHVSTMHISVSAEGSFNPDGHANRENLVEIAKTISAQGYEVENVAYESCNGSPDCQIRKLDQYTQTKRIHISALDTGGDDAFLNVLISIDAPNGGNWCGKLFGAAASIGGAISGVIGPVFTLASIAC